MAFDTTLQAAAVHLSLYNTITLCSFYVPLSSILTLQELDALVSRQVPSPYLLMGDINGHNLLWGENIRDAKGKRIEDLVDGQGGMSMHNSPGFSANMSHTDQTLVVVPKIGFMGNETWKPVLVRPATCHATHPTSRGGGKGKVVGTPPFPISPC